MAQPPFSPQPGAPSVTPVFPVHCVHSHVVLIGVGMPMRRIDAQADRVQELAATMSKSCYSGANPMKQNSLQQGSGACCVFSLIVSHVEVVGW